VKTRFALPLVLASAAAVSFLFQVEPASSLDPVASDPGVRFGTPDAGAPIAGLTAAELAFFERGKTEFEEADGTDEGLGPTMNLDSCAGCHAQPATGGTSPFANPQVAFANANGATNRIPPFIQADGPVREARFVRNADGTRDGGVHALFTLAGRADAPGCALEQPDFDAQLALGNVIFRIPTPVFGAGLIEQIPDKVIRANQASNAILKGALGISGRTNHNGNDGTIARFGWKAQNKSLLLFSGEAYNVEMGITNELFQTERDETASCQFTRGPITSPTSMPLRRWRRSARSRGSPSSSASSLRRRPPPIRREAPPPLRAGEPVRGRRLRAVPHARAPYGPRQRRGSAASAGQPVFRPAAARHGRGPGRRHHAGASRPEGISHRAAVGTGKARLLPA